MDTFFSIFAAFALLACSIGLMVRVMQLEARVRLLEQEERAVASFGRALAEHFTRLLNWEASLGVGTARELWRAQFGLSVSHLSHLLHVYRWGRSERPRA